MVDFYVIDLMFDAMAVYHLSAQFPGPTTPRDFVTLLLTSYSALCEPESLAVRPSSASDGVKTRTQRFTDTPRHFMVISRPCIHPDCPARDGFIRGQYESVEFIREIPKKSNKASSTTDLSKIARQHEDTPPLEKELFLRNTERKIKESGEELLVDGDGHLRPASADGVASEGRKRGKTISFAGSRGASAKGEAMDDPDAHDGAEMNAVEWIMITRSDPGGSVPRFMVERGTPGGIVADASKFLDWACKKEHPEDEVEALEKGDLNHVQRKKREELDAYATNGHLAGLDDEADGTETPPIAVPQSASVEIATAPAVTSKQGGLVATVASAAYAGLETYAPQAIIDRLPSHQHTQSTQSIDEVTGITTNGTNATLSRSVSSASSIASFASAEDHFDDNDTLSAKSTTTSQTKSFNSKDPSSTPSPHEKELAKLTERKKKLDETLAKAREKELKDKEDLTSKEEERIRRAEEKHAKEVAKQEERYKKEIAKLEAKRLKDAVKADERKRKEEDRDEKRRLAREKEEMRRALEVVGKERDILREQVGALQRENTGLVARLGKLDEGGQVLLKEVKKEMMVDEGGGGSGGRSRSGSLRRGKGGKEATVLAGEEQQLVVDGEGVNMK